MNLKISVILTTYQGATRGYLSQAIESVLNQTFRNFELIIIDDGSTDSTKELCYPYLSDSRVSYHFDRNVGLAGARNKGIALAHGEYICFLDDDDLFELNKLQEQFNFFEKQQDPHIGMCYTALTHIDEKGNVIGNVCNPSSHDLYAKLFNGNIVSAPSSVMIRKAVLDHVGHFTDHLKSCEDYDLWLRIAKHYQVCSIDQPLVRYRVHQNKMSTNFPKMHFYQYCVLFSALQSAPEEIKRNSDQYYHRFYQCCCFQYLGARQFINFRRHYKLAAAYGKMSLQWKLAYTLSHWPDLYVAAEKLKKLCQFASK